MHYIASFYEQIKGYVDNFKKLNSDMMIATKTPNCLSCGENRLKPSRSNK